MANKPQDLAKQAVASFGQPAFAGHVNELLSAVGDNRNTAEYWLAKAGLKQKMMGHASSLKKLGRHSERRDVMRQVGLLFGNATR